MRVRLKTPIPTLTWIFFEMHEVPFQLLGVSLKLQTDEDPQKLVDAIAYLQQKIDEVKSSFGLNDALQLALIAGLKLAEEIQLSNPNSEANIERWTKRLIDRIDEVL